MYKILGADGKEYGPVNSDVVRQWITEGRATGNTKVRPEGSIGWINLSQLPEFATLLSSGPGSSPPPFSPNLIDHTAPTSGLAIASVVCGALGLIFCITSPVGLVLGLVAQNQIKKSNGQLKGSGLAIT